MEGQLSWKISGNPKRVSRFADHQMLSLKTVARRADEDNLHLCVMPLTVIHIL